MIVLKIIGIVLGSLLALILLLVLWILFSPIRYKGRISYDERPDIKVTFSYLLWIVRGYFILDGEGMRYDVKLLFKSLMAAEEKVKTPPQKKRKPSEAEPEKPAPKEDPGNQDLHEDTDSNEDSADSFDDKDTLTVVRAGDDGGTHKKPDKKTRKNSIFKRLLSLYNKIAEAVKNISKKAQDFAGMVNDPHNRAAVSFIIKLLKKLIKHILPRRHRIDVEFGTGDPASTGELLGVMYAVGAMLSLNLFVTPDFENKVLRCDVPFKGRICVFLLLVWFLQAYRNEDFRQFINQFKK